MAIITSAEVKTLLQIPSSDSSKDALISSLITKVQDFILRRINNFADPKVHMEGYQVTFNKTNKTIALSETFLEYGFLTAGFASGNQVLVEGSYQNDQLVTISSLTEGVLTVSESTLVDEENTTRVIFRKIVFTEDVKIMVAEFISMKMNKSKDGIKSYSLGDYSESLFGPSEMLDTFSPFRKLQWD